MGVTGEGVTGMGVTGMGVTGEGVTGMGVTGEGVTGEGVTGMGVTAKGVSRKGVTGTASGEVPPHSVRSDEQMVEKMAALDSFMVAIKEHGGQRRTVGKPPVAQQVARQVVRQVTEQAAQREADAPAAATSSILGKVNITDERVASMFASGGGAGGWSRPPLGNASANSKASLLSEAERKR